MMGSQAETQLEIPERSIIECDTLDLGMKREREKRREWGGGRKGEKKEVVNF